VNLDLKDQFVEPGRPALGTGPSTTPRWGLAANGTPKHSLLLPLLSVPFYAALGDAGAAALQYAASGRPGPAGVPTCPDRRGPPGRAGHDALVCLRYHAPATRLQLLVGPHCRRCWFLPVWWAALQQRGMLAGVLLGLSIPAKWSNVVLIPGVLGWLAWQRQWPLLRRLALGLAGPCAAVGVAQHRHVRVRLGSRPMTALSKPSTDPR